jgi:hypothetical protein
MIREHVATAVTHVVPLTQACFAAAEGAQHVHGGIPVPGLPLRIVDATGVRGLAVDPRDELLAAAKFLAAAPIAMASVVLLVDPRGFVPPPYVIDDALPRFADAVAMHSSTLTTLRNTTSYFEALSSAVRSLVARLPNLRAIETGFADAAAGFALPRSIRGVVCRPFYASTTEGKRLGVLRFVEIVVPVARTLTALDMSGNMLGRTGLTALSVLAREELATLRRLNVAFNDDGDEVGDALAALVAPLPCLTHFDMSNNDVGRDGAAVLAALRGCTLLRVLALNNTGFAPHELGASVATWPQLRAIAVNTIPVLPVAEALGQCRQFAAIEFTVAADTPDAVGAALAALPGLTKVDVAFRPDVPPALCANMLLPLGGRVKELGLHDGAGCAAFVSMVIAALSGVRTLTLSHLDWSYNRADQAALYRALQQTEPHLRTLSLPMEEEQESATRAALRAGSPWIANVASSGMAEFDNFDDASYSS